MAIIEGTLLDEGGAVYNVKAYGLTGNSDPADGTKLWDLLDAVPANSTILFPPGTYLLDRWRTQPGPYVLTKRLRLVGSPGAVIQGPGPTYDFLKLKADVEVEGLGFTSWRTVLDGTGSADQTDPLLPPRILNEVRASRCRAENLRYFVFWTVAPPPPPEDPNAPPVIGPPDVRRLVVEDCHFQGITHGVMYMSMNVDEVVVRNNVVIDCVRYVCHLLKGEGEAGRGRLLFEGNYVRGLTQGNLTGNDAVARVVQASVERVELVNNYIRDVSTLGDTVVNDPQGGSNFAYITSSRLYVAGNLCWDVGSPGTVSAIIHEKNHDAIGAQIIGNTFIQSASNVANADAVQILGKNGVVDGLYATGMRGAVVATDRSQGTVISNVSVRDHRGINCILILGGRDIHVQSPQIRGHVNAYSSGQPRGITIMSRNDAQPSTDPTRNDVTNIRVSNPMIRDVNGPNANSGIGVLVWAVAGTMRRIAIHGGSIMGCDRAFELAESGGGTETGGKLEEIEILDTDMRENRVAIVNNTAVDPNVDEPGNPNVSAKIIVRDSQGYRTENRGTATVPAGAAFVAVAHGLARAPLPGGISVTPAGNLGAASRFWADTVTATHFTIRTDVAPGGTGVPFSWQADAEEV